MSDPISNQTSPSPTPPPSNDDPLIIQFTHLMDSARLLLDKRALETSLQTYTTALHLSETHPPLLPRKYEVVGNIGWINCLSGRYAQSISLLTEALDLSAHLPPNRPRVQIAGELGNVYRLIGRDEDATKAFDEQYRVAKEMGLTGPMCRAVGNLGVVSYGLGLKKWKEGEKEEGKKLIEQAMKQLRAKIRLAKVVQDEEDGKRGHGATVRERQAVGWEGIGYSRLSLCYDALVEMEGKEELLEEAESLAEKAVEMVVWWYSGALPLAKWLYARVLLKRGKKEEAAEMLNPKPRYDRFPGVTTPAMAMCKQPSVEYRGWLTEAVEAGADLEITDDEGYTALDHAVFNGDEETINIVLEGLKRTGLSENDVEERKKESLIRKGYREVLQEKLRPILYEKRPDCVKQLRRAYAEALSADPDKRSSFDRLKFIPYLDFARFGRLPRSTDGLVQEFKLGTDGQEDNVEYLIFFSYRWINSEQSLNTPDDANHTQYHRMLDAIGKFLKVHLEVDSEKLCIWMDFACVDQDDPSKGVTALPIIISQCDAVISLDGPDYYDRAWCCVEAKMIQSLRRDNIHVWYEHRILEDGGFELKKPPTHLEDIDMKEKQLTFEQDRHKVMFLARQSELLYRSLW